MSEEVKRPTTTLNKTGYGVEYTITVTGQPRSFAARPDPSTERDMMIGDLAEMIAPVIAAHAFPNTTRSDVADALVPYSEEWEELREVQSRLQKAVEDVQSAVRIANVEDAYREWAVREYLNTLQLDRAVHSKIIRLLTTKQQDTVPPAA